MGFWKEFDHYFKQGRKSPFCKFVIFFLLIQFTYEQRNTTNVASRLALLASMSERTSFEISPYKEEWTTDWSQTPDGKVYSNKAPGPAFLAFPLYWIFDRLTTDSAQNEIEKISRRHNVGHHFLKWASFLLQVIPFSLLAIFFLGKLVESNVSPPTQIYWLLAFLFGTTASVFLNTYFGHGLATVCVLFLFVAISSKHWAWAGFFFGWALLSDYSVALILPALLIMKPRFIKLTLGALIPAGLWIWYHTVCFGSPFTLPNKFQNPIYIDVAPSSTSLWGVIDLFPNLTTVGKLLWGPERGFLFSQPWVLLLLITIIFSGLYGLWRSFEKRRKNSPAPRFGGPRESLENSFFFFQSSSKDLVFRPEHMLFVLVSFVGVFWMNASFGGWHGGASAGPRYMTAVLPLMSLFLLPILESDSKSLWLRTLRGTLKVSIRYSFILFGLILSVGVTSAETGSLLGSLLKQVWEPTSNTAPLRFTLFTVVALWVLWTQRRIPKGA